MNEEQIAKWAGLVPEVYYDLISRVPSGAFVVLALVALYHPSFRESFAKLETGAAFAWIVILFGTGYSAGLLLGPVGEFITHSLGWRGIWKSVSGAYPETIGYARNRFYSSYDPFSETQVPMWRLIERLKARRSSTQQCQRMYRQIHDFLKQNDAQAMVVLPKMQAEAGLCANLAAGPLLVIGALGVHFWPQLKQPAFVWTSASFLLALWASRFRTKRLMERHFSYLAAEQSRSLDPTKSVKALSEK